MNSPKKATPKTDPKMAAAALAGQHNPPTDIPPQPLPEFNQVDFIFDDLTRQVAALSKELAITRSALARRDQLLAVNYSALTPETQAELGMPT